MVVRRWPHSGRGGGGSSMVVGACLAAEVAAWRKRNFSSSSSAFGNAAAAWWWRQQQRCVGGGSMAYADNNFKGKTGEYFGLVPTSIQNAKSYGACRELLCTFWTHLPGVVFAISSQILIIMMTMIIDY